MKTNYFFMIASAGIIVGMLSVFVYNKNIKSNPPISVSYNPYESGVYASGIIESFQRNGSNVNIYPEISGRVESIPVVDGMRVKKGDPLFVVESHTQQETAKKSKSQVDYQIEALANAQQQYDKLNNAYQINPKAVSKLDYDNAKSNLVLAAEALRVAQGQLNIDESTLAKYTVHAPFDGVVLRVVPSPGDYVSPAIGAYDPYTQGNLPVVQLATESEFLQVRAYIDEILTPRLPDTSELEATLFVRGLNNHAIPLKFVNIQPYTIPNIQLSDARNERVDVRVLPIIFQFERPKDIQIFPGQLVDVYIKGKS
uniref:Secretion protein HlyD family protein n=1 Tax=uncultured microorganism TaxID=358574 RepID=F8UGY2_9ZZZZ|nr:secretion protein HlyD family protein [uncultured microorganism]